MWVTKLLISPVKKIFFAQKRPNLAQNWHFWSICARPCRLIRCPVGGSFGGCGARAVSRKTPIYFMIMTSDKTYWLNLCLCCSISWPLQLKNIFRIEVLIWMTNMILMRMMMLMLWWWGKSDGIYLMVFAMVNFAAGQRAGLRWIVKSSMLLRKVYVANEKVNVVTISFVKQRSMMETHQQQWWPLDRFTKIKFWKFILPKLDSWSFGQ